MNTNSYYAAYQQAIKAIDRKDWDEALDLLGRDLVGDRLVDVLGRHVVIFGGDGQIWAPDAPAAHAETIERLRTGDFVHQVQIDVEQFGLTGSRVDQVAVPELLGQRRRCFIGHVRCLTL